MGIHRNVAHPTENAVGVIKPLVEAFAPIAGLVLDPFAGSGRTLVVAALAGRRYFGVELEGNTASSRGRWLAGVEQLIR